MVSVSLSDVKNSDYPDRTQVVSVESEGQANEEHQYVAEIKKTIDGPHGRVVVLSRVRGPSLEDGSNDAAVHDRYFYYDDGIGEIPASADHLFIPPESMLDSVDAYVDQAERIAVADEIAAYDTAKSRLGWGGYDAE
jgi:hypothetical protein